MKLIKCSFDSNWKFCKIHKFQYFTAIWTLDLWPYFADFFIVILEWYGKFGLYHDVIHSYNIHLWWKFSDFLSNYSVYLIWIFFIFFLKNIQELQKNPKPPQNFMKCSWHMISSLKTKYKIWFHSYLVVAKRLQTKR